MKYVMLCLALMACLKPELRNKPAEAPVNVPTPNRHRTVGIFTGGLTNYTLQAVDDSLRGVTCYRLAGNESLSCVKTFEPAAQ